MIKALSKRVMLDGNDPLLKRTEPILLTLLCKGVLEAPSSKLMTASGMMVLLSPIGWIISIVFRGIHICIVLAVWWFLRDEIAGFGISDTLVLAVAIVAVLYKDIYQELVGLLAHLLIFITGGAALRWMCDGYLHGNGFRQFAVSRKSTMGIIANMISAIPYKYKVKYDEIMNLYFESNIPENEARLNALLDSYTTHGSTEAPLTPN